LHFGAGITFVDSLKAEIQRDVPGDPFDYLLNQKRLPVLIYDFAFDDEFSFEKVIRSTSYSFDRVLETKPRYQYYYKDGSSIILGGYYKQFGPLTSLKVYGPDIYKKKSKVNITKQVILDFTETERLTCHHPLNECDPAIAVCSDILGNCNDNGFCNKHGSCLCHPGYFGIDCSI